MTGIRRPSGERPGATASGRVDPCEEMATPSQPGDASASPARALLEWEAMLSLLRVNPLSAWTEGR